MKLPVLLCLFVLLAQELPAQKPAVNEYAAIDKKALQLPDSLTNTSVDIAKYISTNFVSDKEKVRAIFIWIVTNIQYDIDNMFAINFYEKKEEKIAKALRNKKGICENYAALFTDVCTKAGIKSFVVEGYTKQNGFTDYIPHAWCAAFIDSAWFLFDPTWDSGSVVNGKFVRKINNEYFKVSPAKLIKSHMPFDFLWQFLNYPVTNQEFYEGKTQADKNKPFFSYTDSIKVFEEQNNMEQLAASAERIERNGVKNAMIFDRLQHLKMAVEHDRQTQGVNLYNAAGADYNEGVNIFNDFIQYRNKQFTPLKTDPEIQAMVDNAGNKLKEAKAKLDKIKNPDVNIAAMISQLTKSIEDAMKQVKEQQDWLQAYFGKGKAGRKSMFYDSKITWFGMPVK